MSDIDTLVDEAISAMPKPSPMADEIIAGQTAEQETENVVETPAPSHAQGPAVSSFPMPPIFDAAIHAVDASGNPIHNQDGSYRKRKGPRKGNSQSVSPVAVNTAAKEAGAATAQMIFVLGSIIGGAEWAPVVDDKIGLNEPKQMADAWEAYYIATDTTQLPPWLGVAVVMACYAGPRLWMPQTKARLEKVVKFAKEKIMGRGRNGQVIKAHASSPEAPPERSQFYGT